jgi:hypothetical protein
LIVNTQHGRSPLQAHLACETAPPSRLILHETRLSLDKIGSEWYTFFQMLIAALPRMPQPRDQQLHEGEGTI